MSTTGDLADVDGSGMQAAVSTHNMSTTGCLADVDGSGMQAAVSSSSLPDLTRCAECHTQEIQLGVFCTNCKEVLCKRCDTQLVHISRVTRTHARMSIEDYLTLDRCVSKSAPTTEQLDIDEDNKLCSFNPIDHHIRLGSRLASLVEDPNEQPSMVAFIGPTGVGKSTLVRLLVPLKDGRVPLAGAPNDLQSTSADLHVYPGGQVPTESAGGSAYPLLYVDSEGLSGSHEPRAMRSTWKSCSKFLHGKMGDYKEYQKIRSEHVQVSYPRMLYIFSDVLCFVFSGDPRQKTSIVTPLLDWVRSAAVGAANQHRPQLIIVFNKKGQEASEPQFDDFREAYKSWIGKTGSQEDLESYYSDPLVCFIPLMDVNAFTLRDRVENLRLTIMNSTKRIRKTRHDANQLFTRCQLQLYMQLAANTFTNNPYGEFDIYKASMAQRPTSVGPAGYIVEFHRTVDHQLADWDKTNASRHLKALAVLKSRIGWSVLLRIGRLFVNYPVGARAHLPEDLRTGLQKAQELIDDEQPCAASMKKGNLEFHCDTVQHMHLNGHVSGIHRWPGGFIPTGASWLVNLAKNALQIATALNVKDIREQLFDVRLAELSEYGWLKFYNCYRVCASCMMELPTEVLSCGHIICALCAKEEAKTRLPKMNVDLTCPVCLQPAKWYPKDLPALAGYRILSLDGGGIRGIVQLLSFEKIMSFFPGMHVEDLFDIIVGTSTGGIIALALTVNAFNEQPKRLGEVIPLFQELCTQVFSPKMLRLGAEWTLILRAFQFLGIYDTKYKNDNLLKLLKKYFGEQSLMESCVRGPHVIVTSCDCNNNNAGAWFTSYNRPILENELPSGRVEDNHTFSAKDAAAATTAAGTYFPSYEAGSRRWIDGGLRYNCPAEVAIKEARILWPKHRASALLSLGCGNLKHDKNPQHSDNIIHFIGSMVNIVTDSESKWQVAVGLLGSTPPGSSGCSLRLNPTITVAKGDKCELDHVKKIPFLREATKKYLNTAGRAEVEEAANLLFAALFYLDVEIHQDSREPDVDKLSIRSRAALPQHLQSAFNAAAQSAIKAAAQSAINAAALNAARYSSSSPFSVTVRDAPNARSEFLWADMQWDQNFMYLPFKLVGLPGVRPLDIEVKLHMRLPETTVPNEWSRCISGMPCKFGALDL